ncbi:MAG: hypothetical protein C4557_08850 [Anaerolineaceae bacterium]|jgi:hypothetical protein|nr:MAG: hypothetical protein C4557_08850 [Anaerolineaceae bacterium]
MKNIKSDNPRISEGIILALSSAGAYLFAFFYERGFASIFKIPTSLITIDLTTVLIFGVIFIGVILLISPFINLLLSLTVGKIHPSIQKAAIPIIFIFIVLLIQIILFGFSNWKNWFFLLVYFVAFSFLQFVFPLITQRGKKYADKLEAQNNADMQHVDIPALMQRKFGNDSLLIVLVFIFGMVTALSAGAAEATKQEEFLVTNTTPELVVLRIYGDNLICVPFNRATGEIEQSFSIIKNTGETGLVLRLEKLGQLHLPTALPTVIATATPLPIETLTPTISAP